MNDSKKLLSDITVYSKYARYLPEKKRRETWDELVARNMSMHLKKYPELAEEIGKAYQFVYDKKVLPSMRSLQFGSKPIELNNARMFNCSYLPIDDYFAFAEVMFLLMSGCGVGYSVQENHIKKLPTVKKPIKRNRKFLIPDTIEGWADTIKVLMKSYFFNLSTPVFDYSLIRPKGSPLKTSGGRAPGPQPLKDAVHNIRSILDAKEINTQLTSLEVHDILCHLADAVLSGGIRRSSAISLFDIDDSDMLECKFGQWWEDNPQRARSNNSAAVVRHKVTKKVFDNIWEKVRLSKSGEPGIFFTNDSVRYGTNPCFSGDTLIAVADGRNAVSLEDLTKEGKDVPVYCVNHKTGEVGIRWGRSPRITGYNRKLIRVHLDNNTYIDVTPEHKFPLKNGLVKEAKDLVSGDSLFRFKKMPEHVSGKNSNQYYRVYTNCHTDKKGKIYEHRMITEFYYPKQWKEKYNQEKKNGWLKGGLVVHHKDYNSLNNSIENLEVMTFRDHAKLHSSVDTKGEKNGKYSGFINEEIEDFALSLTEKLKRRFSSKEWEYHASRNGIPKTFSNWRREGWFQTPRELSEWAAIKLGYVKYMKEDLRTVRKYQKLLEQGYKCEIVEHRVLLTKACEQCKKEFKTQKREISFCSNKCSNMYLNQFEEYRQKMYEKMMETHQSRKETIREIQAKTYSELKFLLKRIPYKKEFIKYCKENNISPEVSRKSSPFRTWKELKQAGENYNHKIVKIEELKGDQNVYNITVDDFHTVGIVTSQSKNKYGNTKFDGIFTFQCGEISLKNNSFCNLTEVNVSDVKSQKDLNERVRVASFIGTLQAGYTDFHYLRDEWKEITEKDALIGIGMTGIASGKVLDLDMTQAAEIANNENKRVAKLININPAARVTTVKPSGTSSIVLGCSSGIHAWHAPYYIRRMRFNKLEPIAQYLQKQLPDFIEDDVFNSNNIVLSIPVKAPGGSIYRDESALEFLERVKKVYTEWVKVGHRKGDNTNNVSATVSVGEDEWEKVGEWMWKNRNFYNGLSVLPRDNGTYVQAPFEDISKEKYEKMIKRLKSLDLSAIIEEEDNTELKENLACAGGNCEVN